MFDLIFFVRTLFFCSERVGWLDGLRGWMAPYIHPGLVNAGARIEPARGGIEGGSMHP